MHVRHLVRRVSTCLAGLALVTVAAVAVATVSGGPVLAREAALDDPIVKLTALLRRVRDQPTLLEGRNLSAARSLLVDVRLLWSIEPSRAQDAALVMLDVMGQYLDASNEPTSKTPESELRDAARSALEAHLDPAFGRWLALEILAQDHAQPIERRLAVARAVLSGAPIVLLDEPTAHLDADSERLLPLVANNLAKLGVRDDAFLLRGREQRLRERFKDVLKVHDAGR